MPVVQAPCLDHGLFEAVLDDDRGGPGRLFSVARIAGKEAEAGPEAGGLAEILLELQVDVPEPALMTYGGQVVPRGGNRR